MHVWNTYNMITSIYDIRQCSHWNVAKVRNCVCSVWNFINYTTTYRQALYYIAQLHQLIDDFMY